MGSAPAQSTSLPTTARALLALAAGALWGAYAWQSLRLSGDLAADFTWHLRAARAMLNGLSPYSEIQPTGAYPFDAYYKYPLPAALLALPFTGFSAEVAAGLFVAVSVGGMAWVLGKDGNRRLPILLSGCLFSAVRSVQLTPLLVTAFLAAPAGVALAVVKPNVGAALFASRPSVRGAALASAIILFVTLIEPSWIWSWLQVVRGAEGHYRIPVLGGHGVLALGPLLLLVLLRWRDRDARLVAALACVPQVPSLYDQLPLLLVARTWWESAAMSVASLIGVMWWIWSGQDPYRSAWLPLVFVYLPAMIVLLLRALRERREQG